MPRARLSRLLPALLLLAAVYVALRQNAFGDHGLKRVRPIQQHALSVVEPDSPPQYSRRIVAVGDLHGDYPNALRVLQLADVVDSAGNWTGKVDLFVQTGDIIDR